MKTALSINGVPIRLPEERWGHISERHPELGENQQEVLQTITSPDIIQRGDFSTLMAIRRKDRQYLVVIYREVSPEDGFVIIAYLTESLKRRVIVWRR